MVGQKKYKNIVWDWNGTLLNDADYNIASLNILLSEYHLKCIDKAYYLEHFRFPVREFYEHLGFDFSIQSWNKVSVDFLAEYKRLCVDVPLSEGVVGVLHELKQRGYRLFVLSALEHDSLIATLKVYGLSGFFDGIYGNDDIYASGKVATGEELVRKEKLVTQETLMIGDTLHDAEVANALGFDTLLYSGGHNSRKRLAQAGQVIDGMTELLSYL